MKSASPFIQIPPFLLLLAPLERERRPLTCTEDKCACQGSILMPFNVCQPSSLLITFLPYQLQGEEKRRKEKRESWRVGERRGERRGEGHTFHVVPITSVGSGAERDCSSRRRVTPHLHRLTDTSITLPQKATGGERQKQTKQKKSCPTSWDF